MRNLIVLLLSIALLPVVQAQVSAPPRTAGQPVPGAPAGMQASPMADISSTLAHLNQVVTQTRLDLARLRFEKWKTDSSLKRQAESNADSVQRNITTALPTIVQQVRANPGSISANFKLYRNLNALYDVMMSLTESAGAFGSKDEYQALANDTSNLDSLRRSMADQVEAMASARDIEIAQLQARARQAATQAAAPAPKKIVIDDNQPAKKQAKKTSTKKKPAATTSQPQQQTPPKQ